MRTEHALAELCDEIFATLPRRDQRRRGLEYIRGLIRTPGRKSIRNMAGPAAATEQRLHHFVSDSTWDWMPVRRALGRHLTRAAPPVAWVAQPMIIPKTGEHTVGVARRFCPARGLSLNAQHAVGVWAATATGQVVPVHWLLHLSPAWLADPDRRRRAGIPDTTTPQPLEACVVESYLDVTAGPGLPVAPVVVDATGGLDAAAVVQRFRAAGVPMLVRVDPDLALSPATAVAGHPGGGRFTATDLLRMAPHTRRPVFAERAVAATVPLQGGLHLLGAGAATWLTDLDVTDLAALVRLTRLPERVARDEVGDRVGLKDFTGRSFTGWHRHVTLASAAHAVVGSSSRIGTSAAA